MISTKNITQKYLSTFFNKVNTIKFNKHNFFNNTNNKILVNAFFEPSTRTSMSFECAMNRLGGKVINFQKNTSSLKKGESILDTLKTIENYGDIMVIRHPDENLIHDIVDNKKLNIPVINGGNGAGEHPTQALLDLYTIYEKYDCSFDNISKIKILFMGDICDSRTVNSFIELLHLFPNIQIHILPYNNNSNASNELLLNISKNHNMNINDIIIDQKNIEWKNFDIFYVTRYQKERKSDEINNDSNVEINENIIINQYNIKNMKKTAMIMHPLPRNEEINPEIDNDERVYYYKQMNNGVYIRMALIDDLVNNFN